VRPAWGLVVAALLGLAGKANAQPTSSLLPRIELDYRTTPGLGCPTAEEVKAEIAKQIDDDPFTARGPVVGLFHVEVKPKATDAIEIAVSFDDVTGRRTGETSFKGTPRSARTCAHLVRAHAIGEIVMELSVQMSRKLRTLLAARAASPECTSGSGSKPAACFETRHDLWPEDWPFRLPKPKPDPPPLPERWPTAFRLAATAVPEAVASGWGSIGITAQGGYRYRSFSVGLEVHDDPSIESHHSPDGNVTFNRLTGAILACYHIQWFAGCAVGDAGAILFPHHVQALPAATFYSDVGVQVALEFPLPIVPPWLFLHVGANVMAPINPSQFFAMTTPIFQVAGPSVGVSFGPVLELPGW
jgi:hypothetical protein